MNNNSSLGNVLSKLQGLKNVSGRKVMPGAEFLEELEPPSTDVEGTSQPLPDFSSLLPMQENTPQADLGGELNSQSYDVRANTVNNQNEQGEEPGFWSRIGSALADYVNPQKREQMNQSNQGLAQMAQQSAAQTPPVETAQVDLQEGLPPVTASEEYPSSPYPESSGGFFGALKDYVSPTKNREMDQYNQDLIQNAQLMAAGQQPQEVKGEYHEGFNEDINQAVENPWQHAAYGAAQEVANNPELTAQFKTITGIDYEPQIAQQVSNYEESMKGIEDSLNGLNTQLGEQAEQIKQRILNNQQTDSDKYYIGLALLMPLIVGGIFGKEAALGALSGSAKGFADVLGGRQKSIKEDEASLLDLSKQQSSNQERLANIGAEKTKFGSNLRKNLPEDQNSHLVGMRDINWQDPQTGEEKRGVEIKPGLVARPEFISTKEGLTDVRKAANELSTVKTFVKEVDDLTDDIANIVTQLKDPSVLSKGFISFAKDKIPGSLSQLTQDVMFDGRKQNAGTLLEEKLGFLANAYGMAKEIGQLDRAAQQHIKKIIDNPTSTLLTPKDALNQVLEVRKLSQQGLIENASNKGFYPEFITQDLSSRNEKLFGNLNKQEQDKRLEMRKQQAMKGQTNYAK